MSDDDASRELATVTRLPARHVVDAEIVSDEDYNALQRRRALERWGAYRRDVVTVTRVTKAAVTHDRTKAAARHGAYVLVGAGVIAKRLWQASTNTVPNAMVRSAVAAGDHEAAGEWWDRGEQAKKQRHQRRMDWLDVPARLVRAFLTGLVTLVAVLLVLGAAYAWASGDISNVLAPIRGVIWLIAGLIWLVTVTAVALPFVVVAVVVVGCWAVGRHAGCVPGWLQADVTHDDDSVVVTPLGIADALAHLPIAALKKAIKDGWQVTFLVPPVMVNGRGYHTVFSVPKGVTAGMIADCRDVFARNLIRAPLEVWPTEAEQPGYVDCWVANPGATQRPGSEYPLLHDGVCDVFAGVPLGESQRGDVIAPPSVEANYSLGGMPGQGKSNGARVVAAGWALDPIAELSAFVFANNGDFDAYEPRLFRYRKGVDDDVARDALTHLRGLYADVAEREGRLAKLGAKKVTRGLAEKHPDLRPRLMILSECHELFGHPEYGKEAADLATKVVKRSRKTAIVLLVDTQSSRAEAIPPKLVELLKINSCFAVKTWRSNDGFLGDGSFQAGIRATELRPGKDRGTSVTTGATAERFEIVKWFYIEADDDRGYDAATEIVARAMQNVRPWALGGTDARISPVHDRDLLTDVADVLGPDEVVRARDVVARLRKNAPEHGPYASLNGAKLVAQLKDDGVRVTKYDGYDVIHRERVYAALDARDDDQ